MLKLFRPEGSAYAGQDVESWDLTWEGASITEAVRWAAICHLRPFFDRYFPRSGKILEGGCGLGQFVIYFRSLGYDIEGVDFSPLAVSRLKVYDPALPVRFGDVTDLPYPDGSIQCYSSGGVVEHFEGGPFAALAEARRVLSHDGRLLVTVPFLNSLRRAKILLGVSRRAWGGGPAIVLTRKEFVREPSPVQGYHFAEYVFGRGEFSRTLDGCGFWVEAIHPCDLEWGELCQFLYRRLRRAAHPAASIAPTTTVVTDRPGAAARRAGARRAGRARAFLKEFIVSERPRQPWLRPLLGLLNQISGHMVLFVCRPVK